MDDEFDEGWQGLRLWLVNRFGWEWLLVEWWRYVLDDSRADTDYGSYFQRCRCRAQNHRAGVYWFNAGGLEPDMHCKGCGEDLG